MCVAGNTVFDLTRPGREPHTYHTDSNDATELIDHVCFVCTLLWVVLFPWLGDHYYNKLNQTAVVNPQQKLPSEGVKQSSAQRYFGQIPAH